MSQNPSEFIVPLSEHVDFGEEGPKQSIYDQIQVENCLGILEAGIVDGSIKNESSI